MVNNKLFPLYNLMQDAVKPLLRSLRPVVQKQGAHLRKPEMTVIVRKVGVGERTVTCVKLNLRSLY